MSENNHSNTPWWKIPHMWLVVGGPAVVVVAGLTTLTIAIRNPDPVLNKNDYERDLAAAHALQGKAKTEALLRLQPAELARNHAASPHVKGAEK